MQIIIAATMLVHIMGQLTSNRSMNYLLRLNIISQGNIALLFITKCKGAKACTYKKKYTS